MTLEKSDRFNEELQTVVLFIARDSPHRALKFFDDIISKIKDIPIYPFSHRQRYSTNDIHIRELIFKGYCVPYYIDNKKNTIIILGIFNQNEWKN